MTETDGDMRLTPSSMLSRPSWLPHCATTRYRRASSRAARVAWTWRVVDAELAELLAEDTALVRSATDATVAYAVGDVVVDVERVVGAGGVGVVVGLVTGATPVDVAVEIVDRDGAASQPARRPRCRGRLPDRGADRPAGARRGDPARRSPGRHSLAPQLTSRPAEACRPTDR